ncbi:MAG: uroporphyrinogen-III synthase [Maricaulaceae bacterium]
MNRIWITRSQPGAEQSAAAFKNVGFTPLIAPLLEITPPKTIPALPPDDAVLIFTSKNGVNAFCTQASSRDWPVVTVGDATAELARSYGFSNIRSADGRGSDIPVMLASDPATNRLYVHVSGSHVRGDIVGALQRQGRKARRDIYYQSTPVERFPDINLHDIEFIVFYSPMTAQTFVGFMADTAHITAISLSPDIDDVLAPLDFTKRYVADKPTQNALLKAAQQSLRERPKTR